MERPDFDRRRFVLSALPTCAGVCALFHASTASGNPLTFRARQQPPASPHKFDSEMARKLTYRELFTVTFSANFIPLALLMMKRLGRDTTLDLLKTSAAQQGKLQGAQAAKAVGGSEFAAFKKLLSGPAVSSLWTKDVVEDSDSAYELRVTECLWAATFQAAKADECGYAAVCHGDYAFATGFNPRLQLLRDHTLMQGHAFCNHRYLWKK